MLLRSIKRWFPQPFTAIVASLLAVVALLWVEIHSNLAMPPEGYLEAAMVSAFLGGILIWAGLHPVHIQRQTKLYLVTVPLFLMAVLLPPAISLPVAGFSMLLHQVLNRSRTGNYPSDIATWVSRWMLIVLLGSYVAHTETNNPWLNALVLPATAVVMFAADTLTAAFEIGPMWGEPPSRLILMLFREGVRAESVQYLLGMLTAFAARQEIWALFLVVVPGWIVYRAFKYATEMQDSTRLLVESMADAVDLRDPYTGGHSRRVAEYAGRILQELGLGGQEAELIVSAARVHDIGKIGIPDGILNKPGRLTPEEQKLMQSHSERGAALLTRYPDFARARDFVMHHHERWDGNGYPHRIKEYEIPLGARVIAVADSYDAMTSDRPYRKGMTQVQACRILFQEQGRQWDPKIVEAFLAAISVKTISVGEPQPQVAPIESPQPAAV